MARYVPPSVKAIFEKGGLLKNILEKAGYKPSDVFEPVKPQHYYAVRSVYRSLYPKASPQRIAQLTEFAKRHAGPIFNEALEGKNAEHEKIDTIRSLAYAQDPRSIQLKGLADTMDALYQTLPEQGNESAQGKLTLRSRSFLPGQDSVSESKEQKVSDTSQAELFSYHPDTLGISSLELGNRQHEAMLRKDPSVPRLIEDQRLLPFEMPYQYEDFNADVAVEDRLIRGAQDILVKHLPASLDLLDDVQMQTRNPLVDTIQRPGPLGYEISNPLPVGFSNYLGFKADLPQKWREPLVPDPMGKPIYIGSGGLQDWVNGFAPQVRY